MLDRTAIGLRIRAARVSAGLSGVRMARKLGVSKVSVCTWERGQTVPRLCHLVALAKVVRRSLDWLICGKARSDWRYLEKDI